MLKICPTCQKPFWIRDSHAKRTTCSRQCRTIYFKGQLAGERNPSWKGGGYKACQQCGKLFWVRPSQTHLRKTCSYQCMGELFKKRWSSNPENHPSWKGGRQSISQRIRGCEKNRKLIFSILKRDKYTCQKCGQVGGDLEVDHIKPFAKILDDFIEKYAVLDLQTFTYELSLIALKHKPFWDKKNMRALCRKCNWERELKSRQSSPAD